MKLIRDVIAVAVGVFLGLVAHSFAQVYFYINMFNMG